MALLARDNPFATARVLKIRYEFIDGDWDSLFATLERTNWRGAIRGPEGSGKSTLMQELAARVQRLGLKTLWVRGRFRFPWLRDNGWRALISDLDAQTVVFVDSAECLPAPAWWFLRICSIHARGLIVTLHNPGRIPTLHEARTSPELLTRIVNQLSRDTTVPRDLFASHSGNIREALRTLYDRAAGLTGTTHSVSVTRE